MPELVSKRVEKLSKEVKFHPSIVQRLTFWFGYVKAREMLFSLKTPTSWYPIRVNTLLTTAEELIQILENIGVTAKRHDFLSDILLIPVEGPFRLPSYEKKVVAYKTAAEGVMRGANLYLTGVREVKDVKKGDNVEIVDKFGQKVAVGKAVIDLSTLEKNPPKNVVAVEVEQSLYHIPMLRETNPWNEGLFYQQTIPSAVTVHILDPQPGEKILDMCAAPGGKTTHIAQLTKGKARIVAVDHSNRKVTRIKKTLTRLKVRNVKVLRTDARTLPERIGEAKFDKILLDPPCTALGIRPKLFDGLREKDVIMSARYQRGFIKAAIKLLKPGGYLVYSTCTLDPDENELNLKFAMEHYGDLELIEQKFYLGSRGLPLLPDSNKLQRFYPDEHDTPGYFISLLQKKK